MLFAGLLLLVKVLCNYPLPFKIVGKTVFRSGIVNNYVLTRPSLAAYVRIAVEPPRTWRTCSVSDSRGKKRCVTAKTCAKLLASWPTPSFLKHLRLTEMKQWPPPPPTSDTLLWRLKKSWILSPHFCVWDISTNSDSKLQWTSLREAQRKKPPQFSQNVKTVMRQREKRRT